MNWDALRQEFPITRRWAYLDHAAVAPISGRAQQAFDEWAADMAANGDVFLGRWEKRVEEVRGLFGRLLNTDPKDIAFTKNTSEGIGFIAEGFPWQDGDNVVTAAEEYPSNLYPWMNLGSRGVSVKTVPSRDGRIFLDDIVAAIDSRTRLVSLSSVEYASGFRNDLGAIGKLCRECGIFFFVDAIQSLGVLPLDVQQTPIDALAADGHKWLLGPEGAGVFYLRREWVERLHTVGVGWNSVIGFHDFSTIDFRMKPHAGRWESGTLNVAGIHALGASMDLLLPLGIESIGRRVLELTDHLCERALEAGLGIYSSRKPGEKSGIVSLLVPGDPRAWVRQCKGEGIVINQRMGRIRVSPHFYNTVAEIDRLVDILTGPEG